MSLLQKYNDSPNPDNTQAEKIVFAILRDISDRKGLGNEWNEIDEYTQTEILYTWVNIVDKELNSTMKLSAVVDDIMIANPIKVEEYRNGKVSLLGFFMGEVMKQTRNEADPRIATELVKSFLDK